MTNDKAEALANLRARLDARRGRPGFREAADELTRMIADMEASDHAFRSSITGRFVSREHAAANPATTYRMALK